MVEVGSYWRHKDTGKYYIEIVKVEDKEENAYYRDPIDNMLRVLSFRMIRNYWVECSEEEFKKDRILKELRISIS